MNAHRRVDAWAECINAYTRTLVAAGRRPVTIQKRRYQIRRFAEDHVHRMPGKVNAEEVQAWLAKWTWSAPSLKSEIAALRGFYRWMRATGRCKVDPTTVLESVRVPHGTPNPAPELVLDGALDGADQKTELALLSGGYGGARCGETSRQGWADMVWGPVRLDDGTLRTLPVTIRLHGKGGNIRTVPVHRRWGVALADEYARRQAGEAGTGWRYGTTRRDDLLTWVFPGRARGHTTAGTIGAISKRALGLKHHTLRHRFATRALRKSGNLRAVQRLLGHASVATTQIYTLVTDDELAAVVDAI